MRPKLNWLNLQKASRHPQLLLKALRGFDENTLAEDHLQIHLNALPELKSEMNGLTPIDKVCKAIDILSNPCYQNAYLYLVCKIFNPKTFVETGVFYGVSSAFILKALQQTNAKLYSIDLPNVEYNKDFGGTQKDVLPENMKTGFLVPSYLESNWNLQLGDSKVELPKLLQSIGRPIDIFHHDSMHIYDFMMFEYETVLPKLAEGGLLLSDDALWNKAFEDFCKEHLLEYRIYHGKGIAIK